MKSQFMKYSFLFIAHFAILQFFSGCMIAQTKRAETVQQNLLSGTSWKVDGVPFESRSREKYTFTEYEELEFGNWGHTITFDTKTFSSHYSAPCGNDCFTSVYGDYYFVEQYKIKVKVTKIHRSGFCDKNSEDLNQDMGNYILKKIENGWELTREN